MASNSIATLTPQELDMLSSVPAMPPPPGTLSNFADPVNQNQPLYVETSLLLGLSFLFILNRVYNKLWIARKTSWDDLTLALACIGTIAYYAACIWGAKLGKLGVHIWDINIPEVPSYLITVLTPPTMLFLKVSFFILYLQIFAPMRWLRVCSWIGITITTLFYGTMSIMQFVLGTPRPYETWYSHQTTDLEMRALSLSVPQSAVGLAIDLFILILPIIAVSKLQLRLQRKIQVMLVFMTGLLACISSLLSIYYRSILSHSSDITWVLMPVNTVTLTEMFVGLMCASMPAAAHTCRHHSEALTSTLSRVASAWLTVRSTLASTSRSQGDQGKEICVQHSYGDSYPLTKSIATAETPHKTFLKLDTDPHRQRSPPPQQQQHWGEHVNSKAGGCSEKANAAYLGHMSPNSIETSVWVGENGGLARSEQDPNRRGIVIDYELRRQEISRG